MMPPPTERKSMGQIDVTSKSRTKQRAGGVKARIENFLRAFEWTWTSAVTFALVLVFFLLISTSIMPSFWMYYAEQKIGWAGPTDIEAFLRVPFGTSITNPLSAQGYLMVRDGPHDAAVRPGARGVGRAAELAQEAPRWRVRHPAHRRIPLGATMPFTKTEVDIHDDYTVEAVDPAWLAQGVKSPKHLMLDPDNCILCRACEDVCPWNCIWMMSNEIVEDSDEESVAAEVHRSNALFIV